MKRFEIDMWVHIIRYLPKKALYFSFIHVLSHSTTGKYSNTDVDEITAIEAIKRFSEDNLKL
jgi:hypothetical protein